MKKIRFIFLSLCFCMLFGCATPQEKGHDEGPSVQHGFSMALAGLGHLLLSPLQIAAGVLEGIASVPYYLSTNLQAINQGLVDAQADVTLEGTYQSAYGTQFNHVPENGDTGVVFLNMKQATSFFQKVLKQYGVLDSPHYILTAIEESNGKYTLLACVYRASQTIEVLGKKDRQLKIALSSKHNKFYESYQYDIKGKTLDTIIDWTAIEKKTIQTQKSQAILLTLAANSVLNEKRTPEYWEIEKRWLAGESEEIVRQRSEEMKKRMGI
jgi:hypothetical protein